MQSPCPNQPTWACVAGTSSLSHPKACQPGSPPPVLQSLWATPWGKKLQELRWEAEVDSLRMRGWPLYPPTKAQVGGGHQENCIVCSSMVLIIRSPDTASHHVQSLTLGWLKCKLAVHMLILISPRGFPLGLQNRLKPVNCLPPTEDGLKEA